MCNKPMTPDELADTIKETRQRIRETNQFEKREYFDYLHQLEADLLNRVTELERDGYPFSQYHTY